MNVLSVKIKTSSLAEKYEGYQNIPQGVYKNNIEPLLRDEVPEEIISQGIHNVVSYLNQFSEGYYDIK